MKLSIVTISQNSGMGLRETANSVLSQSRLPDEYIVQDGDSSDGSVGTLINWLGERRWLGNAEKLKAEMLKWEREDGGEQEDRRRKTEDSGENAENLPPSRFAAKGGQGNAEMLKGEREPQTTQKNAEGERETEVGGRRAEVGGRVALWGQACEVKIQSEVDAGIYDGLNRAIARASGDVMGLLHADDTYAQPGVLELVMQAFENGAEAVYGDLQYVRHVADSIRVARHWRSGSYAKGKLRWGWMPPHPTLFLRREVYESVALADGMYFDPRFRCAGDYDFILRALPRLRVPPVYIPYVFVKMKVGGISNRNLSNIMKKSREDWVAIRRNRVGAFHTLIAKNLRKVGQLRVSL